MAICFYWKSAVTVYCCKSLRRLILFMSGKVKEGALMSHRRSLQGEPLIIGEFAAKLIQNETVLAIKTALGAIAAQ